METRTCQNCKADFLIESDDFAFYEKFGVPAPTQCPKCRRIRRLLWLNDVCLYRRECMLCSKKFVSIYEKGNAEEVLCPKCFFGNEFNPEKYSIEYDPSKSFFEQFDTLFKSMPKLGVVNDDGIGSTDCLYNNDIAFSRNCVMCFVGWKLENSLYCCYMNGSKDVCDCHGVNEPSELMYEGVVSDQMARSKYVYWCSSSTDCILGYDLRGCTDCFMSFGLRNKRYYFRNKKYSKEEYESIVSSYSLYTRTGTEKAQKEFTEFIKKYPRKFAELRNSVNCTGTDLTRAKNTKDGNFASFSEDSRYCNNGVYYKQCYDCTGGGEPELAYECVTPDQSYNSLATVKSWRNRNISYCVDCHSSEELFGCVGIKSGQYMIFNKRYEKDEYHKLKDLIIKNMSTAGEYGEFFPKKFAPCCVNETRAIEQLNLTKEEALASGFRWQDNIQETRGRGTISQDSIPNSIEDVTDAITTEVLECILCERNYKILPNELTFYRKMGIPIPSKCFFCRMAIRENMRGGFDLADRECVCKEEDHGHESKCTNQFKTFFTKETRPIYCEDCYVKILD